MHIGIYFAIFIMFIFSLILGFYIYSRISNKNNKTTKELLTEAKQDSKVQDLIGTWEIKNKDMPIRQFTINKEDIVKIKSDEHHYLGCPACNTKPAKAVKIKVKNLVYKNNPFANKLKDLLKNEKYVYKLVLHSNGVVKFIINPDLPEYTKLLVLRADSRNWFNVILNIIHRKMYGCFCLGILSKDGKSIQRYNRWMDKYPDEFYKMVKIT